MIGAQVGKVENYKMQVKVLVSVIRPSGFAVRCLSETEVLSSGVGWNRQ